MVKPAYSRIAFQITIYHETPDGAYSELGRAVGLISAQTAVPARLTEEQREEITKQTKPLLTRAVTAVQDRVITRRPNQERDGAIMVLHLATWSASALAREFNLCKARIHQIIYRQLKLVATLSQPYWLNRPFMTSWYVRLAKARAISSPQPVQLDLIDLDGFDRHEADPRARVQQLLKHK